MKTKIPTACLITSIAILIAGLAFVCLELKQAWQNQLDLQTTSKKL